MAMIVSTQVTTGKLLCEPNCLTEEPVGNREVEFFTSKSGDIIAIRSGGAAFIPDDRGWWETIWNNRNRAGALVHSHPSGMPWPSQEDLTTYQAYELGLGRNRLEYLIATNDQVVRVELTALNPIEHEVTALDDAFWWLQFLRELSYRR